MMMTKTTYLALCTFLMLLNTLAGEAPIRVGWTNRFLTISGPALPGVVLINYLEAYCRPGSTDRDWSQTVIPHKSVLKSQSEDGTRIVIQDTLEDGVIVDHTIAASDDTVTFQVTARNPTERESLAHWAQPCMRVDKFTGSSTSDTRALYPAYIKKCFLFVDGKMKRLPTEPWADKARYIPGQVYCPTPVDRNDVNPRPLSIVVPSNGLCGCFSADEKKILAVAWEPYQEIFQGVIACMHNDFRIGGLKPGETKSVRGKIYIMDADIGKLTRRFASDFPEQAAGLGK